MKQQRKSVEQTLAELGRMSARDLQAKYLEVFGEPTRSGNRPYLFKRIAWRIQSLAEGTLSDRARRRAEELARDADLRTTAPRITVAAPASRPAPTPHDRLPTPGTVLTRTYRGKHVAVTVGGDGTFEYDGQSYRSLSAVAKAVTGSHWNGHLFFGLTTLKRKSA